MHISGLQPEAHLPSSCRQACVALDLGYDTAVPIPDLQCEDDGIIATLSFDRKPFQVYIPWETVFAITVSETGKGVVWPSDMPPAMKSTPSKPVKKPNHLRLVK